MILDCSTGIIGTAAAVLALIQRAELGGSFVVDISLNYYNSWLINNCGTYPDEIWRRLWKQYGQPVFQARDNMAVLLPAFFKMLHARAEDILFKPQYFEDRLTKAVNQPNGLKVRAVKPINYWTNPKSVQPGFNVGTRGNGVDASHWPKDLMVEVVT